MKSVCLLLGALCLAPCFAQQSAAQLPRLTLEEAFNYVQIQSVAISPDGNSVVIGTRRANWQKERFERTLWLYQNHALSQLTASGTDHDPLWSPDSKWIAFLSNRPGPDGKAETQVYVISGHGGEAFPVTHEEGGIHSIAWSPDSKTLYFAAKHQISKADREAHRKEWHDVVRFRDDERGDVISGVSIPAVIAAQQRPSDQAFLRNARVTLASLDKAVSDMAVSPDGTQIAFDTDSASGRVEDIADYELYVVSTRGGAPRRLTRNQASESDVQWSRDGRTLFFHVGAGSVEGKYEEVQGRIYSLDFESGKVKREGESFAGSLSDPSLLPGGSIATTADVGTEVQIYVEPKGGGAFRQVPGRSGSYASLSTALDSPRIAFVYSAQQVPGEVYIADSMENLRNATPITAFNALFTRRALPRGIPYTWTADDGTKIEGWLIYPPGKFGAKHLRMLTLIHGGPSAADGNHLRSDWYDWAVIAASNNWLVFRPNYRGSVGYGDAFMRQISPHLVSRPGKDILEGVDALVRNGIADPDQLTIGGYSYGGYMTNWLITHTTRFRAAITGAGAVEHAVNWGNDDLTFDDAWYLGGAPWEAEKNYNEEAAMWLMNRVRTPTHMVVGGSDIRVAAAESYMMERELHTLGVPCKLLVFPGEGHLLTNNPWHGRIKVREELKWLDAYSRKPIPVHEASQKLVH